MPLQSSETIRLSEIQIEFGGSISTITATGGPDGENQKFGRGSVGKDPKRFLN